MALARKRCVLRMGDTIDTMEGSSCGRSDGSEVPDGGWRLPPSGLGGSCGPLLAGEFHLYDFGLSEVGHEYGPLALTHLHTVATVVEHFAEEGLTYQTVCDLEELLAQHSDIICDEKVINWT